MAGNLTALDVIQVGTESTWGTGVTATAKLAGVESCNIESTGSARMLSEMRGSLAPAYTAARGQVSGKATLAGQCMYEDLNYLLESLLGTVTPTGAGPYVRSGAAPLAAVAANRILTLYRGQSTDVYRLQGGVVSKLTISGKTGEELKYSADLIGKNKATGTLAVLSDRSVNVMDGSTVRVYVDAWGGTIGTTQLTALATSFELSIDAGTTVRNYLGALDPARYRQKKFEPGGNSLKLSLEFDATSKAYLDTFLTYAGVVQHQVRLNPYVSASLAAQFDFAGTLVEEPKMNNEDGVITLDLNYQGTYHSGLANWFKYSITNGLAALP